MARRDLDALELGLYRFEPVLHMGDPWTVGPGTLLPQLAALQRSDTPESFERYATRLGGVPRFLRSCAEVMREGLAEGDTVPKVVVRRTERQIEGLLRNGADRSPALDPIPASMSDQRQRAVRILDDAVLPAFAEYLDELHAYAEKTRGSIGLCALPEGEALYAATIHWWTSVRTPAEEIHALGVETLQALNAERHRIARALGFEDPASAAQAFLAGGRGPTTPDALLSLVRGQVERSWEASTRFFGRMPRENCEVRPVLDARAEDVLAYYQPAPADGSRLGIYFVNVARLEGRPLHRVAAWTYHEANPGHHLQLAIEQEAPGRPAIRRFSGEFASGAFVEGWGLYAERLADEMGLYADDYERLGLLDQQAFRAARLVVDTGIHAFQWSREAAIEELERSGLPTVEAVIEADRYIAWPGQALSYRLGHLAIERWREAATKRLGGRFSLAAFHDHLLSLGSLPLSILEREMQGFDG
jgi:uncharacterized protein (DUF885 family)